MAKVRVRVTPGIRANPGVAIGADGILEVRVRERAIEGAANAAVVAALAAHFEVPTSAVEIVSGRASRVKTIRITET